MAESAHLYPLFFSSLANGEIDLNSNTIKAMLVTDSYTPSAAHQYKSSVTGEVSGPGYTAGGATVGSITFNVASGVWSFDGADASWGPNATIVDAHYLVLYNATPGSDAARPLIGYVDFDADRSSTNSTFVAVWDPSGIGAITVA